MVKTMTGRQRMLAAHRGEAVDRVPIWLREGFPIAQSYPDRDDFGSGWMWDPVYLDLYRHVSPHVDAIASWGLGGWPNRYLMVPPERIHSVETRLSRDVKRFEVSIDTPRGTLVSITEEKRGSDTTWHLKPLVESVEDLKKLAEVPFDVRPSDLDPFVEGFRRVHAQVGDAGIVRTSLSSPIVAISHCMQFQFFLELSITERELFHELLTELTRRNLLLIDAAFNGRHLDTVVNIGGSEQCTPPMMAPRTYDEYVVPYDGAMVTRLKQHGVMSSCHCHGKINYALGCIRDMGFVATDPVEPPPAGDVTYAQARAIADGKVTLIGNLEWDELCFAEPAQIRAHVKEVLSHGPERLILSASAGPICAIDPRLAANYKAMVATALELSS